MRHAQTVIAVGLLLTVGLTCAVVSWASRSPTIGGWTEQRELQTFKSGGGIYLNRGSFVDFEDRLLLDEIPATNFGLGGVYFFGTSTTKWALMTWELPDADRALVHNFAIGASNHRHTAQLVQHLIAHHGLLSPGGSRVQVVIGCFWSMGKEWPDGFFSRLWSRYGLYQYDESTGVQPLALPSLQRQWIVERARLAGFVSNSARRAVRAAVSGIGIRTSADAVTRIAPTDIRRAAFQSAAVPNWEVQLNVQMAELRRMTADLRRSGVQVTLVHLPTREVYDETPFPVRYASDLRALAHQEGLELVDLSRLLREDEFADVNHANYAGLQKLNGALMRIARPHLNALQNLPR